ncbi:uncharacterized protein LOC109712094 [Ananas comosus]|uniref:Uncharacterized protein LOC109712094 n=1 Tax=Ananas comosus TaxID=4615 RepID=A0A6P5F553_ANACO|nr:uncharacterized protein LOC109712094 [Ananas comosus]
MKCREVALFLLVLVVFILSSSHTLSTSADHKIRKQATRKLLLRAIPPPPLPPSLSSSQSQQQEMRVDGTRKPVRQAGVSFRRIPPSGSNPTQNSARPRIEGPKRR